MTKNQYGTRGEQGPAVPLASLLDGKFTKAFDKLPKPLQRDVARRFFPHRWDDLSPEQRETLARAADAPERDDEFSHYWSLCAERSELLRQITTWWLAATPTAADRAIQEDRVTALRNRIEEIDEAIDAGATASSDAAVASARLEESVAALAHPTTPSRGAATATARQRERRDAITVEIEAALDALGGDGSASEAFPHLARYAGKPGSSIVSAEHGTVVWRRANGNLEKLTMAALAERIRRLRQTRR
jgi:hypothetical protein